MAGELWKDRLPLLRARETVAWNEVIEHYYDDVFQPLLAQARRLNSDHGGAFPDPEVQVLAKTLTHEAFMAARDRIENFDPSKATSEPRSFITWIYWLGMSHSKGLLGEMLRQEQQRAEELSLDKPAPRAEAVGGVQRGGMRPFSSSAEDEALAAMRRDEDRQRIGAILRAMPTESAKAIVMVWTGRLDGLRNPVQAAASRTGRTVAAMDSLLRRAYRDFQQRWDAGPDDGS